MTNVQPVVLDTNVFVAAGFNPHSHAAHVLQQVRDGDLRVVWHPRTRAETKRIIRQIPPLSWGQFEDIFTPEGRYDGPLSLERYTAITDSDDRKFAALAAAMDAILVTNDRHLLSVRDKLPLQVVSTKEFAQHHVN